MTRLTVREVTEGKGPQGYTLGPEHHFACSACNKPLASVQVTKPDDTLVWKVHAKCCYCGDRSSVQEVRGLYSIGGAALAKAGDEDEYIPLTKIADVKTEGNRVILHTAKA